MLFMFSVIFARPIIFESFLKPAFSLETSEISVEIDTVYLLFCDVNRISIRRIRAFIRYIRKIMKSIFLFVPVPGVPGSGELGFDPGRGHYSSLDASPEPENLGSIPGAGIIPV